MDLEQKTEEDFVLVHAEWEAQEARDLVQDLASATHVIVMRTDAQSACYYLMNRGEALEGLTQAGTVQQALDLQDRPATDLIDVHTMATAPDRCVVHEDGHIVGFVDSTSESSVEAETPTDYPSPRPDVAVEESTGAGWGYESDGAPVGGGADGGGSGGGGSWAGGSRGGGSRGGGSGGGVTRGGVTRGGGTRRGGNKGGGVESEEGRGTRTEAPPEGEGTGTATRYMEAEFPATVPLHQTGSLLVSLNSDTSSSPTPDLKIMAPLGSAITVIVQARRGFAPESPTEATFTVSEGETLPKRFVLRATEEGTGEIRVLAFLGTQPLGMLTLTATVGPNAATAPAEGDRRIRVAPLAPVAVREPDLMLLISEGRENGETVLRMWLAASDPAEALRYKSYEPVRILVDPAGYFAEVFADIEGLDLRTDEARRIAEDRLAAKGAALFGKVFPVDVQRELWRLRERITSVQICSAEPWIPWELCRLCGEDETGRVQEGPFLCEAFALTRSLWGIPRRLGLTLANMAVVVPVDSGLAFAPQEWEYMRSLAKGGRAVTRVDAGFREVRKQLASGTYDVWHFSGHGAARSKDPNRSAIYLNNKQPLTPDELSGEIANLGRAHPLVFLNACQVGQAGMSLTDIGGWAQRFLRAGASGFVGAYWSVYDKPALGFAQAFYDRLLAGVPIGRAAQEARAQIRSDGDPTWLAYTVFADPLAALVDGTPERAEAGRP